MYRKIIEFFEAWKNNKHRKSLKKPLENYRNIDAFKIYVSDLGLLCAKKDLTANDILYMVEELNDFKGGIAENYVNVQLTINGYHTYHPTYAIKLSTKNFAFEDDRKIVPLYAAFCI